MESGEIYDTVRVMTAQQRLPEIYGSMHDSRDRDHTPAEAGEK